jgi:hypothetical protein
MFDLGMQVYVIIALGNMFGAISFILYMLAEEMWQILEKQTPETLTRTIEIAGMRDLDLLHRL